MRSPRFSKIKTKKKNTYFHDAYWNLIIGSFGIILTAILTFISNKSTEKHIIYEPSELRSSAVQNAGVALLVASLPLLLDICMNIYYCPTIFKHGNGIIVGRLFYALGTFLLGLEITLQIDVFHIFPSFELSIFWFVLDGYRIITVSSMMFFIAITDLSQETVLQTIIFTSLMCMIACCHASKFLNLIAIFYIFRIYAVVFVVLQNIKIWKYLSSKRHQVTAYAQFLYVNLFLCAFFVGITVRFYFRIFSSNEKHRSNTWTDFYEVFPILSMYTYIINTVVLIVIPGWIDRKITIHSTKLVPE